MKNFFAFFLIVILLSSCGTAYDGTVYSKLVDISILSRDSTVICTGKGIDIAQFKSMRDAAIYVSVYESGVPNSEDVQKILNNLLDDIERFGKVIAHNNNFSETYCRDKIQNIHFLAQTALKTEGMLTR